MTSANSFGARRTNRRRRFGDDRTQGGDGARDRRSPEGERHPLCRVCLCMPTISRARAAGRGAPARRGPGQSSYRFSSEVAPEVREFDRASTTVVNAYTARRWPATSPISSVNSQEGIDRQVLWMTSSGGLVPSRRAAGAASPPDRVGSAAGAVAAAEFGRIAVGASCLSTWAHDAKLCLIPPADRRRTDSRSPHYQRFRKGSGFPAKLQSIQMIEIGAGGGSIAAKNPLGLLDVGSTFRWRASGTGGLSARRYRAYVTRCRPSCLAIWH